MSRTSLVKRVVLPKNHNGNVLPRDLEEARDRGEKEVLRSFLSFPWGMFLVLEEEEDELTHTLSWFLKEEEV